MVEKTHLILSEYESLSVQRFETWNDMAEKIRFILNGEPVESNWKANERLLDVLREEFRMTGVKCGCREGECGACSVLIDGQLANSCLVALGAVSGREVETIEGFSTMLINTAKLTLCSAKRIPPVVFKITFLS